ncbi:DUF397 domain-containing protein [Streptomyces sp. NPDC050619]|uniref:DUF397 domain-containing protein n=1 Tax=Streptomyces sp. NPDC050619 TaxID=3157214 RepID=UPI0034443F10
MSQLAWQKSTFSEPGSDTCVEVALDDTRTAHLRESDTPGTTLTSTPSALAALFDGIKGGASAGRARAELRE